MFNLISFKMSEKKLRGVNFLFIILCLFVFLSLLGKFHWFFSAFEHFRLIYFFTLLVTTIVFLFSRKINAFFISFLVFLLNFYFLRIGHYNLSSAKDHNGTKLFVHNIYFANDQYYKYFPEVLKSDPDIVAFIEVTESNINPLKKVLSQFPYNYISPNNDGLGYAVFSKDKIELEDEFIENGAKYLVRFKIKDIDLSLVHFSTPLSFADWETQKRTLEYVNNSFSNINSNWVLAGDFNLTPWSYLYSTILSNKDQVYRSANFITNGSWPWFLPDFIKLPIDHFFSNRNFSFKYGPTFGSDHRSMFVQF